MTCKNKRFKIDPSSIDEARDTLSKFIIRARRVEAHSMVKSGEVNRFREPSLRLNFREGKTVSIRRVLPENEEVFESLSARLRPYIVQSEPIYLLKVFKAIWFCLGGRILDNKQMERIYADEKTFQNQVVTDNGVSYFVSLVENETEAANLSNLVMGNAWMYSDLVHADPNGKKADALQFSYGERYYAATSFFSSLAILVVDILKLVKELDELYKFGLGATPWNVQVTASERDSEIVSTRMYVASVGTVIPEDSEIKNVPGFRELTLTEAFWISSPSNHAVIGFYDDKDKLIKTLKGIYSQEMNVVTVLINDTFLITLTIDSAKVNMNLLGVQATSRVFKGSAEAKKETDRLIAKSKEIFIQLLRRKDQILVKLPIEVFSKVK